MNDLLYFSEKESALSFLDTENLKNAFGKKGALLCTLPRKWTLPFILLSKDLFYDSKLNIQLLSPKDKEEIIEFANKYKAIFIRCSTIGETIWDRGQSPFPKLRSCEVDIFHAINEFAGEVFNVMQEKENAFILQKYEKPKQKGSLGNLLRISHTRDHWSIENKDGTSENMNCQRDRAYPTNEPIAKDEKRSLPKVAAWMNNYLLQQTKERIICEWILCENNYYLVQIDNEEEDYMGTNPFQLAISRTKFPSSRGGKIWESVNKNNINKWDKLRVLKELWGHQEENKPTLFICSFKKIKNALKQGKEKAVRKDIEKDIKMLIGSSDIVIRTSASSTKEYRLPRKMFSDIESASEWCIQVYEEYKNKDYAFIGHKYISAEAGAWVEVRNRDANLIEGKRDISIAIHSLWGSPDGLQFFPHDIFEVHLATKTLTCAPTYKSNIIAPDPKIGEWKNFRVKNELALHRSITSAQALDIALQSNEIAKKMGKDCYIMWFVGCLNENGDSFNLPWYWAKVNDEKGNQDRNYSDVFKISNYNDAENLIKEIDKNKNKKIAIDLIPENWNLIDDNDFLEKIGNFAFEYSLPILFSGSTFAHAYYQLINLGCAVILKQKKKYTRVRLKIEFEKIVRDKIPDKILKKENAIFSPVSALYAQRYLIAKLIEEALEIREATQDKRVDEYADLFEVFKALIAKDGIDLDVIEEKAGQKNEKAGSFEKNYILRTTALDEYGKHKKTIGHAEILKHTKNVAAIPFSFFGFSELKKSQKLNFDNFDPPISLSITLESDRILLKFEKILPPVSLFDD